jgi:hypothetical protein
LCACLEHVQGRHSSSHHQNPPRTESPEHRRARGCRAASRLAACTSQLLSRVPLVALARIVIFKSIVSVSSVLRVSRSQVCVPASSLPAFCVHVHRSPARAGGATGIGAPRCVCAHGNLTVATVYREHSRVALPLPPLIALIAVVFQRPVISAPRLVDRKSRRRTSECCRVHDSPVHDSLCSQRGQSARQCLILLQRERRPDCSHVPARLLDPRQQDPFVCLVPVAASHPIPHSRARGELFSRLGIAVRRRAICCRVVAGVVSCARP